MNIDLHTHSYFSDGEHSPESVILEAKKNNVSVLSITDHNVIGYDKNIQKIAKANSICFIEGIEISTLYKLSDNSISLHILGYSASFDRLSLQNTLGETINGYNVRAKKIIEKLNREFPAINLDFEKIKSEGKETYISRNTLARLLIQHEKNMPIKDALKNYVFVAEDDSWMISTEDSFKLIAQAGGVAVLAHSGRELRKMGLMAYENMISEFVCYGLKGLEVYYPKHTAEEICIMKNLAKKYGLYITGGSDWHGHLYTQQVTVGMEDHEGNIGQFLEKALNICF